MKDEKRKPRAYKITDKYYTRAQKKAERSGISLAERIEAFVISYGEPVEKISVGVELPSYAPIMAPLLGNAMKQSKKKKK